MCLSSNFREYKLLISCILHRYCNTIALKGICLFLSGYTFCSASVMSFHPVLMFQEVWGRSFCRTIEKLVEVVQEYPAEVEHIFSPSCVPLVRCAGCCGDEKLECHPTRTTNVTMQMTFVEHQTCECR
uniref:Placental growth factor b n=1 Tax=Mastacembelus armatus TaxID=205130 RepID=A0A3Q3RP98_9TELE